MKYFSQSLLLIFSALFITACTVDIPSEDSAETNTEIEISEISAEVDTSTTEVVLAGNVEIMLSDKLDGILSEYCLDIAGGNQNVDPANGLQAHTCYSYAGDLGTDQVFDAAAFTENLLSMPIYEVCASISALEAGAEITLSACDDSATKMAFAGNGTITPVAAPDLCFTASEESRFGRGSQHQIRDLTLEICSAENAAYQMWEARSAVE